MKELAEFTVLVLLLAGGIIWFAAFLLWVVLLRVYGRQPWLNIAGVMALHVLSDIAFAMNRQALAKVIVVVWLAICIWLTRPPGGGGPRKRKVTPKAEEAPRSFLPRVLRPEPA